MRRRGVRRGAIRAAAALVVLLSAAGAGAAAAGEADAVEPAPCAPVEAPEVLRYDWRLQGLHGFLARLLRVLPSSGEASMSQTRCDDGRRRFEFRATSPAAEAGEYWAYVSETDAEGHYTVRVEETQIYRGKERRKEKTPDPEVVDVLTGLQLIRREPPESPRMLVVWSDGKVYPVVVVPRGAGGRGDGEGSERTRHYAIRGVREAGSRMWKAEAEIWLSEGDPGVPVEILFRRGLGVLRLTLSEPVEK